MFATFATLTTMDFLTLCNRRRLALCTYAHNAHNAQIVFQQEKPSFIFQPTMGVLNSAISSLYILDRGGCTASSFLLSLDVFLTTPSSYLISLTERCCLWVNTRLVVLAHDAGAAAKADGLANDEVAATRVAVRREKKERNVSFFFLSKKKKGRKRKRTWWGCS